MKPQTPRHADQNSLVALLATTQRADLHGQNLDGLDLTGSNLKDANLADATMVGTNLSGANLTGAQMQRTRIDNANLAGATFGDGTHAARWTTRDGITVSGPDIPRLAHVSDRITQIQEQILKYRSGILTDALLDQQVDNGVLSLRAAQSIRTEDFTHLFSSSYLEHNPRVAELVRVRQAALQPPHVVVYTIPRCVQCDATKRFLNKAGITYRSVDLEHNPHIRQAFIDQGVTAAPIVETRDGTQWIGFQLDNLRTLQPQEHALSGPPEPASQGTPKRAGPQQKTPRR